MKKFFVIIGSVIIGIIVILFVCISLIPQLEDRFYSKPNAYKIIDALEQYRKDNGIYPKQLQELTPRYLKIIPNARLYEDRMFSYFRGCEDQCKTDQFDDPTKYILDYSGNLLSSPRYVPSTKKWTIAPFVS